MRVNLKKHINIHMNNEAPYMLSKIYAFLSNRLDLTNLDIALPSCEYSNVSIIKCNHGETLSWYKSKFANTHTHVLLIFDDHYWYDSLFNDGNIYKFDKKSKSICDIIKIAELYSTKKITLLTENHYTGIDLDDSLRLPRNLTVISSHLALYSDRDYLNCNGITKTFARSQHVLCLNNNPRPHRVGLALYLTWLNLNKSIALTFMSAERWDLDCSFDKETILSFLYPHSKLYDQLNAVNLTNTFKNNAEYVYTNNTTNIDNFKGALMPYYESTVVEIITESTSVESTANIAEKFVHCIMGSCFPIVIGTFKNVELYREMGYDMFDDIIDHSYDYEPNPFYRMKMAIDLNIELLTNKDMAVELHQKNQHRLDANINNYKKQFDKILARTIGDLGIALQNSSI